MSSITIKVKESEKFLFMSITNPAVKSKEQEVLEFARKRKEWKKDPVGFLKEVLGMKLPSHQRKLIVECAKRNKITVKSANSIGKSHVLGALAFWWFFTNVTFDLDENAICLISAPTFSQIKMALFANIRNFAKKADDYIKKRFGENYSFLPKDFSESPQNIEYWFDEKSYIAGIVSGEGSSGGGNTLSGRHGTRVLCIIDEGQQVNEGTYSAFEGILNGGKETKYIILGNTTLPNGATGSYYDSFQEDSDFYKMSMTAFDTPNFIETGITLEDLLEPRYDAPNWRKKLDIYCGTNYKSALANDEVSQWENEVKDKLPLAVIANPISVYGILKKCGMNPQQYEFKTRVLAEFPDSGSSCVISSDALDRSFTNYSVPECFEDDGICTMGVDISAGLGRDFSTIAVRRGNKVIYLDEFQLSAPEFEAKIHEIYHEYGCNCCNVERDGLGASVVEHLLAYDDLIINPINSGGSPGIDEPLSWDEEQFNIQQKEKYSRKRDELWFNLANLMSQYYCNQHELKPILLPRNNKLKKQLLSATYKQAQNNKLQVTPKEEIRKKLGSSTDLADAVLFAFAPVGEMITSQNMSCDFMTFKNTSWT